MDSKRRSAVKRSKAEREQLLAAWRTSGKTVPVFAAENGLAPSTLYQWITPPKKGRTGGKVARTRRKGKALSHRAFTEVSVVGQAVARGSAMTVTLRDSHTVTFEGGPVDPAWLGSVLREVKAC